MAQSIDKEPAMEAETRQAAAEIDAEIRSLPVRNTRILRNLRRKYSQIFRNATAGFVLQLVMGLCKIDG